MKKIFLGYDRHVKCVLLPITRTLGSLDFSKCFAVELLAWTSVFDDKGVESFGIFLCGRVLRMRMMARSP